MPKSESMSKSRRVIYFDLTRGRGVFDTEDDGPNEYIERKAKPAKHIQPTRSSSTAPVGVERREESPQPAYSFKHTQPSRSLSTASIGPERREFYDYGEGRSQKGHNFRPTKSFSFKFGSKEQQSKPAVQRTPQPTVSKDDDIEEWMPN